jgi:hypothetical protein
MEVVSFTPRPLYSRGKSLRYPLDRRLAGSQSRSWRGGEEKNRTIASAGNRNPGRSARSIVTSQNPLSIVIVISLLLSVSSRILWQHCGVCVRCLQYVDVKAKKWGKVVNNALALLLLFITAFSSRWKGGLDFPCLHIWRGLGVLTLSFGNRFGASCRGLLGYDTMYLCMWSSGLCYCVVMW